jgi:CheY-like chemotaxis protein
VSVNGSHERRVLVVEDDADSRELLTELLAGELPEAGVEAVVSAEEALLRADAGAPLDAVVTDQTLPGLTGAELATRLKARPSPPVVVLVTGHSHVEGAEACDAMLAKPLDIDRLSSTIRELWRQREAAEQPQPQA